MKTPVKGDVAPHRAKARKEYGIAHGNVTKIHTRKVPSPWRRNESQKLSSPAQKNATRTKEGKELRLLHRNTSQALSQKENLPPRRNTSKPSSGKDLHRNASHKPLWKEHSTLTKSKTWAQGTKESRLPQKKDQQVLSRNKHGIPSMNTTWILPGQKQAILQKNVSQAKTNKRPSVIHRNVNQALPGKKSGASHGNTSWAEARTEHILSYKNASQLLPEEKLTTSQRNATRALPGKGHRLQQKNISWAEENKEQRPSHKNASWVVPRKEPSSSQRNVKWVLVRTESAPLHRNGSQARTGLMPSLPFRNATQKESSKEQRPSGRKFTQVGAGSPRWRPAVPRERVEPIMPSLPTTCLLSEHAIACGNTCLKHVPRLSDSSLKSLYLAENEIAHIPAGVFSGLPNLEWLDLSKNKLDSAGLHPEAFKNLTKLKRLNLDGNQLTTIPALPSSLQELKMNDNNLEGLQRHSFRGLSKLLTLELEGNQLHDGNVIPTTFKPLSRLIYLRLDQNHFRAVPSGLPASLQELHLDSNRIEEVTEGVLNKTLNLTVLVLSNNKLQEDRIAPRAWIDLLKLESLDLSHNRLALVPSFLPRHLKQLTLHHNRIERIPGYVFAHMKPGLEFLHLSHNVLRDDGIHAVSFFGLYRSLAELLLDNNQLQAIPRGILNLKGLQVLRLSHNRIRHIPLNSVCDTRVAEDSSIISMHLENNLIDRRRIPPTAFSCIKAYHSVVLRPQQNEDDY
ncbi:extracellular matrix protein 2-like [Varanus komodoensis]|uniref:extracellular matrix protein 2-like n=1 Tax=Varanus komodoensis TaxID=61221 RepID=UPI001CF7DD6E|nr:extracellular matrix protein 2-like [Varanus komodoensis]